MNSSKTFFVSLMAHQDMCPRNDCKRQKDYLRSILEIFRVARWLGIAGSRKYYWKLWGVAIIFILTVVETGAIWKVIKALAGWATSTSGHRSVTARLAGAILYANALLSIILCWRLSSSWQKLSEFWILLDRAMVTSRITTDKNLMKKFSRIKIFFIFCGVAEYMMSIISFIGVDCPPSLWLEKYILISHGFLLRPDEYNIGFGISLMILSMVATILWNLQDLLLILITLGLASRYQRINNYVATVCSQNKKEVDKSNDLDILQTYTWRKIREAYVKQATLVRKVNGLVGPLILLSNSCNFYFICLHLFLGITQGMSDTSLEQVYYLLSFMWLCIRTSLVVLSAADVNVCSKDALPYLFEYKTRTYNLEIDRLQYQLCKEFVALSGMGFFFLTKSLLLQMGGAVVTYELVLIQFDTTDHNSTNTTGY